MLPIGKMTKLEFRFEVVLIFTVAIVFVLLNVNADTAPNVDIPGKSDEGLKDENPRDYPGATHDDTPRINDVDEDEDDEAGFDDEDEDDDDGGDSLGQSVRGSSSSVLRKKDEIHELSEKNAGHAQLQLQYQSDESGSSGDDEESSSGSGSAEVGGQGLFARQHVSEKEENREEDASAEKDEIDDDDDEDENEEKKNNDEHGSVRSRSNTQNKNSKNLIKMVLKESKEAEQQEDTYSHELDNGEESSGQVSGSANSFAKGSGNTGVERLEEEHPSLKPQTANMTGVKALSSGKEQTKGNVTAHKETTGEKDKGTDYKNISAGTGKTRDKAERKNVSESTGREDTPLQNIDNDKARGKGNAKEKVEHLHNVQNTQEHKKFAKKELIKASKVSPHLTKKKIHNKYLAAHVTHPHVTKSHAKILHRKPVNKAAPPACHSDSILTGHSLKGGTQAGRFEVLGETASMHACLQRCCAKQTCDVGILIDGRCYGVACYSEDLCKAMPVPHPHFIFSQLGFVNKGQKRGDIERNQEFHCRYGNLTLRNNEQWSGELCGGVVRCKDGIVSVTKCPGIPPKPDDCAKPRLLVKHQKGKCCQMKWNCKARHCVFNNRLIKHGYKLSDPLCTGIVSCYNGHLNMEYCPKIPDKPKDCARPKLKTINIPGKCCKKLWICSDKTCAYDGLKLSHGEKLTDASCAVVMECRNGFLHNKQCPGPPPVPHGCINPTLKVKRIPGECCETNWTCEIS